MISIALDFDGVIHSDVRGAGSGSYIPDPPVIGAIEKLFELLSDQRVSAVYIYSLRCGGMHGV